MLGVSPGYVTGSSDVVFLQKGSRVDVPAVPVCPCGLLCVPSVARGQSVTLNGQLSVAAAEGYDAKPRIRGT